jgi:hypothetical protein
LPFPLRRFELQNCRRAPVAGSVSPLLRLARLSEYFLTGLAAILACPLPLRPSPFACPSLQEKTPLERFSCRRNRGLVHGVFALLSVREVTTLPRQSSLSLSLLSRVSQLCRRCPGITLKTAASLAVLFPSTSSRPWAATYLPGLPASGLRCLLSVSHALKAFIRPRSPGLVSCRSRPWDFALQGRFPLAEPCLFSKVVTLLRLLVRSRLCLSFPVMWPF